jgi:uncharacterized protein
MYVFAGKAALVTGASSGIGEAFARALAARGADLILVARSADRLRALADELARRDGVRTDVVVADLSEERAPERVFGEMQAIGQRVDILVNCAGFATHGRFEALDRQREHQEAMLNVMAVVDLTHLFLPAMVAREQGAIINVASTAGFLPAPYLATYGASKAFVLSFSEALWAENRRRGVRVLALCPGATDTRFFDVAGPDAQFGARMSAQQVVRAALHALERNRPTVVPGWFNWAYANLPRFLPRRAMTAIAERAMRPPRPAPNLAS